MSGIAESIAGGNPQNAAFVDVRHVPLSELLAMGPDSPVQRSARRIQQNLADPNGVLSAFSSFVDGS
ncbi:hypothetical protein [Dactylosporangium sp. NPDC051541]|uniref:hypothetical protein n=1 Tax=Dactylosporangium sp. NPDC051541 TaxID=3363977 RepID=UPI0037BC00FD